MKTTEELNEAALALIKAAAAVDPRVNRVCLLTGTRTDDKLFIHFYGEGTFQHSGSYSVEDALASVKPYDSVREKKEEIEKLKTEIATIEAQIKAKEAA